MSVENTEAKTQRLWGTIAWPLGVFVVTRLGIFLLAYFGLILLQTNPELDGWQSFPDNKFLDGWARWDSGWYQDIAEVGYSAAPKIGEQRSVPFFPLYPLTIRAFNLITGNSSLSGILISNLAFGLALIMLFQLLNDRYGDFVGRWSVLLLAVFPFSFYFSAVYSEALFLLVITGVFYFGNRQQWFMASVCAACASATRAVGIVASVGLLILYLNRIDFQVRRIRGDVLWLLLGPLGLALYMGFLWHQFGDPLIFARARQVTGWEEGMGLQVMWQVLADSLSVEAIIGGSFQAMHLLHAGIGVCSLLLIALAWRRLDLEHTVWAATSILLSFIAGWHGIGRYVMPLFPLFAALPLLVKQQERLLALAYLSTLFLALFTIQFSHWYWVS